MRETIAKINKTKNWFFEKINKIDTYGVGGQSWGEVRVASDVYTLPNVKQIASGKQPHSTGRSAPCFVTT